MEKHKLQEYAKHRNMTMTRLAEEIGITRVYLYMLIDGASPSIETCLKINKATGIKITVADGEIKYE